MNKQRGNISVAFMILMILLIGGVLQNTGKLDKTSDIFNFKAVSGNGIKITSPTENSLVSLPINIRGEITSNEWGIFGDNAGDVEIYGIYQGNETKIGTGAITLSNFKFNVSVGDSSLMDDLGGSGYLIITEAVAKEGESFDSVRIPIQFGI